MDAGTEEQEEAKKKGDKNLIYYWKSQFDPSVTWKDIAWMKKLTSLPIVCKGILTGWQLICKHLSQVKGASIECAREENGQQ